MQKRAGIMSAFLLGTALPLSWSTVFAQTTATRSSADARTADLAPNSNVDLRAQTSASNSVAEVVVTARARTERLIDVPVAATVLTADTLKRYSMTQIADVAKSVPQLEVSVAGAGTGANVSIRGVGSSAIDAGVAQPVSIVIDGVGTSTGRLIFLGLFDVEAVEALEGPQALFFGKNSPAGVLSLTTTSPGHEFGGYAKISYDVDDQERYFEGAVTLPITDSLSIRLAGRLNDSRGYLRNTAVVQPDPLTVAPDGSALNTRPSSPWQGGERGGIGRVSVRWTPSPQFDATLKFTGGGEHGSGAPGQEVILRCAPGATRPSLVLGALVLPDPTGSCHPHYTVSDVNLPLPNMIPLNASGLAFEQSEPYVTSLNVNYRAGQVTFTSITGYVNYHYANAGNFDYQSYGVLWGALADSLSDFTQEFRASSSFNGPLNFTAGLLYERSARTFLQDVKVPGFSAINGRYDNAFSDDPTSGNTYSAYVQARYNILDNLELAGGARFTAEVKSGSLQNIYVRPDGFGAGYLPQGDVIHARVANDNVSPEVTLTWHPVHNATLYGAYKTGFLSGGISNPGDIQDTATASSLEFQPVEAKGGEIGAKGAFLNNTLILSSVAYLYDYTNLQVISYNPVTFSYTTLNAASSRVKGAELTANYRAAPGLVLRGALSYNHGRYLDFPNGQCYAGEPGPAPGVSCVHQDLSGTPLGASPDWSGNIGATYEHKLTEKLRGAISFDGYYRGSYNYTASNTYRPEAIQNGQMRIDASIRVFQPDKGWEAAVLVRNLTNRLTILTGSDTPASPAGQLGGYLAPPREVVLEVTNRF
jgi:iron complex outermembrane receptor protein